MTIHENKPLFQQAVRFTAQQMNLPEIYVEKDYWVTFALKTIFSSDIGSETVFKGGTALSKCFGLINRFSEDIDLVVLRGKQESNNQLTNKIRKIGRVVSAVMPEVNIDGITRKMGMNRKTAHSYQKEFQGDYGQIRDVIIIEATWLGYSEPYTATTVSSFIHKIMEEANQSDFTHQYDLSPFSLLVLEPRRTLCEKIMSLVRFSYTEDPVGDLKKKIRHCYDLYQLLRDIEIIHFFESPQFDIMLQKVATDDVASFRNNNHWLANHPGEARIFSDVESTWELIKSSYSGDFRNLVYGDFPEAEAVLKTLQLIRQRLDKLSWQVPEGL
ncbi:MAG: nucleotidyl transferase AbiEii/AbiGii toxin family protein [Ginsengibacter sp.]